MIGNVLARILHVEPGWVARATLLALLALPPLAGWGCERDRLPQPSEQQEEIPLQVVEGMTLRETKAGVLRWILYADTAYHYGEGKLTRLIGVHVDFYHEEGDSIQSSLTAREGEMDPETRDLIARDSVRVSTDEGSLLETEMLRWDQATEKVVSDRFVRLTRGSTVVTGVGIETDAALKTYRICSEVEAEHRDEEGALEGFEL